MPRVLALAICLCSLLVASARAQHAAADETDVTGTGVPIATSVQAASAGLPEGFVDIEVAGGWDQATGITFASDGLMFVWEKAGRIWTVENGVKSRTPFLDISEEVGNWGDHGMLGFALDPAFDVNGHVYLLYVADWHHVAYFGTEQYLWFLSANYRDTIGRLTRYTATAASSFTQVDPASRTVLVGEDAHSGFPVCFFSHGAGSLAFGEDGTLLVAVGDGHTVSFTHSCLSDGIITPKEDVGSLRAQLVDSLSGKILRLDPATGDGLPSNPFYDPTAPRAPRSRVWTLGVRNPFRISLRPGSGSVDPAAADPGTIYLGDVGDLLWEELDVVPTGGLNLGWPIFEGMHRRDLGEHGGLPNLDAPNPVFVPATPVDPDGRGPSPALVKLDPGHGCAEPFFAFEDLLAEDTLNTPQWPNPCAPGQSIPADVPRFVHVRPQVAWGHDDQYGVQGTQLPGYDAGGEAVVVEIDAPESTVAGEPFAGSCSVGGVWYDHTGFPPSYRNAYYHADYGRGWIRLFTFDGNDRLGRVKLFAESSGNVVALALDPSDGSLAYINYTGEGGSKVHRISYQPGNQPPVAAAAAAPSFGPSPLQVQFDSAGSNDPEGGALDHAWDFGDGTPVSRSPAPVHVFPSADVTPEGLIVSRIDELVPPVPSGVGNPDPEVMRDGDYPPLGSPDPNRQFDTAHVDGSLTSDKGGVDWVGYEFGREVAFVGLVYQAGVKLPGDGGWFDELHLQVRSNAVWQDVAGLVADPPYPGAATINYAQFEFRFDVAHGDGIRLWGVPGGVYEFVSVGELRVLELLESAGPTAYDVLLQVTDGAGASQATSLLVSVDNTPPSVEILAPLSGTSYPTTGPGTAMLEAAVSDAEHGAAELSYAWQVTLHHDVHIHPGPILTEVAPVTSLAGDGCNDDLHWLEVALTVTDAAGLSGADVVFLYPECDCNMNGSDDTGDIAGDPALDLDLNGIPDACELDCNLNGVPDPFDVFIGTSLDLDANGIPDECQGGTNAVEAGPGEGRRPSRTRARVGQAGERARRP